MKIQHFCCDGAIIVIGMLVFQVNGIFAQDPVYKAWRTKNE